MKKFNELNETNTNLQSIYENIGFELLQEYQLNESLGGKYAKLIANIKDKYKEFEDKGKKLLDSCSEACKKAIETVKKKAGDAWEKIKDTYTSLISIIDMAMKKSATAIKQLSQLLDFNIVDIENKIVSGYIYILSNAGKAADKMWKLLDEIPDSTKQVVCVNLLFTILPVLFSDYPSVGEVTNFFNDMYSALLTSHGQQ